MDKYREIKWNNHLDAIRARKAEKYKNRDLTTPLMHKSTIDVTPYRIDTKEDSNTLKLVVGITCSFLLCGLIIFGSMMLYTDKITNKTAEVVKETTNIVANTYMEIEKEKLKFNREVFHAAEQRIPKPEIKRPYAEVNGKIIQLDENGRYRPRGNTL